MCEGCKVVSRMSEAGLKSLAENEGKTADEQKIVKTILFQLLNMCERQQMAGESTKWCIV